jgi:hypothetical protein
VLFEADVDPCLGEAISSILLAFSIAYAFMRSQYKGKIANNKIIRLKASTSTAKALHHLVFFPDHGRPDIFMILPLRIPSTDRQTWVS